MTRRSIRNVLALTALLGAVGRTGAALDPPRASERWSRVAVGDIVIVSNAEAPVVSQVAGELALLRPALARVSGLEVHAPRITTVFLFRSSSSFRPYRAAVVGGQSESAAIFLSLRDSNLVLVDASKLADAMATPFRALADSYLGSSVPGIPPWLKAGLAELFATFVRTGDRVVIGAPVAHHVRLLQAQRPIAVAALLAATPATPEYSAWVRQGVFAAESWAIVHSLLLRGDGQAEKVPGFLAGHLAGLPVATGLASSFGTTIAELEAQLPAYGRGEKLLTRSLAVGELGVSPPEPPAALPRDELLLALGDLLAHTRPANTADAEAFLAEAIATNPALAPAYAVRAVLQARLGLDQVALADLEKAVSLDSSDPRPAVYLADFLSERLTDSTRRGTKAPADAVARLRALYRHAIALDGQRSRPWAGLGFTYLLGDGDPSEGIAALKRCLELEPANFEAAFNLVLLYARNGRADHAAALVERVVRHAPDPTLLGQARDAVLVVELARADKLVAAGKPDEAIGILEEIKAQAGNEKLRAEADRRLGSTRKNAEIARQAARFDQALSLIRSRDYQGAWAILEELRPVAVDPDLVQAIVDTESDIQRFVTPRR